jgi:exopolyphosphatase / guanosine-5'-triphosphate,3'-diphosphate pyrophosphatase
VRRVAIIDVGSNTIKLVDVAYEPGRSFRQVDELRAVARLSEGMGDGAVIGPAPFARGLSTLQTFASYCRATAVDDIVAVATSAVRAATNGPAFVAAVRERSGLDLRVLSGEEEARLGALAVANAFAVRDATVLDLGGGSLQLSRLVDRRFVEGKSWPLGAVRATETYLRGDPPKAKSVRALAAAARDAAASWFDRHGSAETLVAMGGTVRNLANVDQKRRGYALDLLHGYRLELDALRSIADELVALEAARRAEWPGLNRDRADIIAAGAVVVAETLAASGTTSILVSGHGVREGLLSTCLVPDGDHLLPDVRAFTIANLMRQYHDQPVHNEHVRRLALALFDALADDHRLGAWERDLLAAAALVHDIGMAVDYYRHEHHGFALVLGRALPGFSHREQAILALLVRHHRKGGIGDGGLASVLEPGDDRIVALLAGVLRVAEYLDRGKAQRVRDVTVRREAESVVVEAHVDDEAQLEVHAARQRSDVLAAALGLRVEVVAARVGESR